MRKLSMDEFITLLPTHFDADILKTLGLFRYNRKGNPESIEKAEEAEIIKQDTLSEGEQDERQEPDNCSNKNDTEEFSPQAARILRSGRKINISVNTLPSKYSGATKAQWKTLPVPCQPTTITKNLAQRESLQSKRQTHHITWKNSYWNKIHSYSQHL